MKTAYLITSFIGLSIILVLSFLYPDSFLFPLVVIWGLACVFFFRYLSKRQVQKLFILRAEQCRIAEFIKGCEKLCRENKNAKTWIISLSSGYLDFGDANHALELLNGILPDFPPNAGGVTAKIAYYNNLAACYIRLHNQSEAALALSSIDHLLTSPLLDETQEESLRKLYNQKKTLFNLENGFFENARTVFSDIFEGAQEPMISKVSAGYQLGRLYLKDEDRVSAKQKLQFAAEHGGDSYYATEAKKLLSELA